MRHLFKAFMDRVPRARATGEPDSHLMGAVDWICRAHDASTDDGVPHSFDLRKGAWLASYPETTGYIVPTLYDVARVFDKPELRERALRMARWEAAIQMPDGGVQAGIIGADPLVPTIFNTGQVLFGLVRTWRETGDEAMRLAAHRAARWLVQAQDEDGCWRRFKSPFTTTAVATYNTRSAFALSRAATVLDEGAYLDAAVRNVEWALAQALPNGWLTGNCLSRHPDDRALTHTLAYAIRGVLEVGVAAGREDFVARAIDLGARTARLQRPDGALPGYVSRDWTPLANWTCVTGNAQMALNWMRIAHVSGDAAPVSWARAANAFNMRVQDIDASDPRLRGAIPGSFPFDGDYMTWRFPNWAAKFFVDALLIEREGEGIGIVGA